MDRYTVLGDLGEGAHGTVVKAVDSDGRFVALKRVRCDHEREGFPLTAVREVALTSYCVHKNIAPLLDVFRENDEDRTVRLVYPYMDHDLSGLMDNPFLTLGASQIKYYMLCLLEAVQYLHERNIMHRDIKSSNVLISNDGAVLLTDFGLARWTNPNVPYYTNRAITLWYRPPELLYGITEYDQSADIWSLGCVFAELLSSGKPTFPGKNELDQIERIFNLCGTPTQESWPEFTKLPWHEKLVPRFKLESSLRKEFEHVDDQTFDLLSGLLDINPATRMNATEALAHPYFRTRPYPLRKKDHPSYSHSHSYNTKNRKKSKAYVVGGVFEDSPSTVQKSQESRNASSRAARNRSKSKAKDISTSPPRDRWPDRFSSTSPTSGRRQHTVRKISPDRLNIPPPTRHDFHRRVSVTERRDRSPYRHSRDRQHSRERINDTRHTQQDGRNEGFHRSGYSRNMHGNDRRDFGRSNDRSTSRGRYASSPARNRTSGYNPNSRRY